MSETGSSTAQVTEGHPRLHRPLAVLLLLVAGNHASVSKGRWIGALIGMAMVVLGTIVFFLLLSGFDGA